MDGKKSEVVPAWSTAVDLDFNQVVGEIQVANSITF